MRGIQVHKTVKTAPEPGQRGAIFCSNHWASWSSDRVPSARLLLAPIVASVGQALVHHFVEAVALLDENLAEGSILAEQDRLQPH